MSESDPVSAPKVDAPAEATATAKPSAPSQVKTVGRPPRVLTVTQRWMVVVAVLAVAIIFVSWIGGRRAEATRERALARGVDALAASLAASFTVSDLPRLRRTVDAMATAGKYTRVLVLTAEGNVAAATDTLASNEGFGESATWPTEAKVNHRGDGISISRVIASPGAAVQGLLVVEVPFD